METLDFDLIIKEFGEYLSTVGYRIATQRMLYSVAKNFLNYLIDNGIGDLEALERQDIVAWHKSLENRPNQRRSGALSSSTIRGYLWALQMLLEQELHRGRLSRNLMTAYPMPKAENRKRETLTSLEIKELYEACETLKERIILHLHYGLGLRRTEAERLNIEDLDLSKGWLQVKKGKYDKGRALPLTSQLSSDFERYLREERPITTNPALLINQRGNRQSGSSNLKMLKALLNRACIHKEIDLHCLRHSIATHLIESGLDIEKLRLWLGHSQIESTKNYIKHDPTRIFISKIQPEDG
jgi:integrase/recombinase XerD